MPYVWGILSFLFWIIGFVMFLGLINPKWINKRLKENQKPFTRKKALLSWVIFSFLFLVFASIAAPKTTNSAQEPLVNAPKSTTQSTTTLKATETPKTTATPKATEDPAIKLAAEAKAKADAEAKVKAEADAKKAEEEKKKKAMQDSVFEFEKSVYALENTAKPTFDYYQKAMSGLGNGSVDINTAYEAATNAQKAAKNLQLNMISIPIPNNLDKEVKTLLQDSLSELSTAYYSKGNAYAAVLKYLDNQKPSDMQKFKDEIKMADSFTMSGVTKIFTAKTKVGIDLAAAN